MPSKVALANARIDEVNRVVMSRGHVHFPPTLVNREQFPCHRGCHSLGRDLMV